MHSLCEHVLQTYQPPFSETMGLFNSFSPGVYDYIILGVVFADVSFSGALRSTFKSTVFAMGRRCCNAILHR